MKKNFNGLKITKKSGAVFLQFEKCIFRAEKNPRRKSTKYDKEFPEWEKQFQRNQPFVAAFKS